MRFNIEIESGHLVVGDRYGRDHIQLDDVDAYIEAIKAAKAFAIANAELPKQTEPEKPADPYNGHGGPDEMDPVL